MLYDQQAICSCHGVLVILRMWSFGRFAFQDEAGAVGKADDAGGRFFGGPAAFPAV